MNKPIVIAILALSLSACSAKATTATVASPAAASPSSSAASTPAATPTSATPTPATTSASPTPTQTPVPVDSPTTEDPTPTDEATQDGPLQLSFGEGVDLTIDDGKVKGTVTVNKASIVRPGDYDDPAKNGRYMAIQITAVGRLGKFDINPFDFALTDDDGTEYDTAFITTNLSELHARTLSKGQKATGWVIYDGPKGAVNFSYRGGGFGSEDQAIWRIK